MGRPLDLTVVAVPGYFGAIAAEQRWLREHAAERGPTAADYERRDTLCNLALGVGSLLAPLVAPTLLQELTPGRGRHGRKLVGLTLGAAAVTTLADRLSRRARPEPGADPGEPGGTTAARVASVAGVVAVAAGGLALCTFWADRTTPEGLWSRRVVSDRGRGPLALAAAIFGWDAIYYWNHRFMHEVRALWAIHVVHHSSERYNLSTALRQPVADALGVFVPSGLLCLLGIRPELVETARGVNLIYQFWIHTDTIRTVGRGEEVLNTPSHHRVHHGSNRQYLDRNHGSILIVWDRLFGTFEREEEPVAYGLTRNLGTFNPLRVAAHEHAEMIRDIAGARTWRDRLSYVVRGPGWAYGQRTAAAA